MQTFKRSGLKSSFGCIQGSALLSAGQAELYHRESMDGSGGNGQCKTAPGVNDSQPHDFGSGAFRDLFIFSQGGGNASARESARGLPGLPHLVRGPGDVSTGTFDLTLGKPPFQLWPGYSTTNLDACGSMWDTQPFSEAISDISASSRATQLRTLRSKVRCSDEIAHGTARRATPQLEVAL